MKSAYLFLLTTLLGVSSVNAVQHAIGYREQAEDQLTLNADRVAFDNVTKAAVATGNVVATYGPLRITTDHMNRNAEGIAIFPNPTVVTTCSNDCNHTHWDITGEVEYEAHDHVIIKDSVFRLFGVPFFYLPYFWYPLDTHCGFQWMPGYTSDWGAYLMTKYSYHILGDSNHDAEGYWLKGATRLDVREEQGVALGEDLFWSLGSLGRGSYKIYHAWDEEDHDDDNYGHGSRDTSGRDIDYRRWSMELKHRWEPTERDVVRVGGALYSDYAFRRDFMRTSFFSINNQFRGYDGNEVAWEHMEESWGWGISASGPLNKFVGGTARMPEVYLDINPKPVFSLPINYESQTRIGYLGRDPAEYSSTRTWNEALGMYTKGGDTSYIPGNWADYDTFRFDTYQRLTAPFKTFDDLLSVVPRVGYHGTYWQETGTTLLNGYKEESNLTDENVVRSIIEFGSTFSMRGVAWVTDDWQHLTEPYIDVLAQEAKYSGMTSEGRPYVFDGIDASRAWEDQFAGRGRNLPYSYYGITPGWRNAWSKLDDRGNLIKNLDIDVYAAFQFNEAKYYEDGVLLGSKDKHRLAKAGYPNYGEHDCVVVPGVRVIWKPNSSIDFMTRAEYDSDNNQLALWDVGFKQALSTKASYFVNYNYRDTRWYDYSSAPYASSAKKYQDEFFDCNFQEIYAGFQYQPIDWFALGPYLRWDIKNDELDSAGAWFDFLTDCLGFRFNMAYDERYYTMDGTDHGDSWNFGFSIYLRAFGFDSASIFNHY